HVSWGYYVDSGTEPDCVDGVVVCVGTVQIYSTPSIWNPLPFFTDVHQDGEMGNITTTVPFMQAATGPTCTLPAVAWVVPNDVDSDHGPNSIASGQAWTTRLINKVMQGPCWSSSAVFLAWDDWGG